VCGTKACSLVGQMRLEKMVLRIKKAPGNPGAFLLRQHGAGEGPTPAV